MLLLCKLFDTIVNRLPEEVRRRIHMIYHFFYSCMLKWWRIYILSNKRNGTLYIWVTNDLRRRVYEHKNKVIEWFSKKHNLTKCIYFEKYSHIQEAISREKELKWRKRIKKITLLESKNPYWDDLSNDLLEY